MWQAVEQKILQIKKAAGVEIIFLENEKFHININHTNSKDNAIINEKEIQSIEEPDQIGDLIPKDIPLSVVLNGKGILIKKVPEEITNGLLQSVLPNANPDDFYYDILKSKKLSVIGIARKKTVDDIIGKLKIMGYKVVSLSLGFSALNNILPFINADKSYELESDSLLIELNNSEIASFSIKEKININRYQPNEYLFANQYVKPANILSFAAASGLLADDLKSQNPVNAPLIYEERKEYRYYKLFKFGMIAFLALIFSLLLINFFIYNHYFTKNKDLENSGSFLLSQGREFQLLDREVRRKERFLNQAGWTETSRASFYADRIAGLVPLEITFSNLQIYPARNNGLSESVGNIFKKDTIILNGVCSNPVDLNTFIENLKILNDFKSVTIKNYQYRSETETGSFQMELITQ